MKKEILVKQFSYFQVLAPIQMLPTNVSLHVSLHVKIANLLIVNRNVSSTATAMRTLLRMKVPTDVF